MKSLCKDLIKIKWTPSGGAEDPGLTRKRLHQSSALHRKDVCGQGSLCQSTLHNPLPLNGQKSGVRKQPPRLRPTNMVPLNLPASTPLQTSPSPRAMLCSSLSVLRCHTRVWSGVGSQAEQESHLSFESALSRQRNANHS